MLAQGRVVGVGARELLAEELEQRSQRLVAGLAPRGARRRFGERERECEATREREAHGRAGQLLQQLLAAAGRQQRRVRASEREVQHRREPLRRVMFRRTSLDWADSSKRRSEHHDALGSATSLTRLPLRSLLPCGRACYLVHGVCVPRHGPALLCDATVARRLYSLCER